MDENVSRWTYEAGQLFALLCRPLLDIPYRVLIYGFLIAVGLGGTSDYIYVTYRGPDFTGSDNIVTAVTFLMGFYVTWRITYAISNHDDIIKNMSTIRAALKTYLQILPVQADPSITNFSIVAGQLKNTFSNYNNTLYNAIMNKEPDTVVATQLLRETRNLITQARDITPFTDQIGIIQNALEQIFSDRILPIPPQVQSFGRLILLTFFGVAFPITLYDTYGYYGLIPNFTVLVYNLSCTNAADTVGDPLAKDIHVRHRYVQIQALDMHRALSVLINNLRFV